MRDQATHRMCAPAAPAWLRPTAGDPHFWRIGVFFEGRCTFLDSYFFFPSPQLGVTLRLSTSTTTSTDSGRQSTDKATTPTATRKKNIDSQQSILTVNQYGPQYTITTFSQCPRLRPTRIRPHFPPAKMLRQTASRPLFSPKRNAPEYSLESIIKDSKELYHHRSTDRLPAESPLQYALRCSTTAPLQIQCLYNDDHILVHMQRHARSNQQPHLMGRPETPQGLITLHLVHFHSQRHPYLPYLRPQRALIVLHPRHQSSTFSSSCLRPQSSTCFLFFFVIVLNVPVHWPLGINYPMVLVYRTSALFVWLMGLN